MRTRRSPKFSTRPRPCTPPAFLSEYLYRHCAVFWFLWEAVQEEDPRRGICNGRQGPCHTMPPSTRTSPSQPAQEELEAAAASLGDSAVRLSRCIQKCHSWLRQGASSAKANSRCGDTCVSQPWVFVLCVCARERMIACMVRFRQNN